MKQLILALCSALICLQIGAQNASPSIHVPSNRTTAEVVSIIEKYPSVQILFPKETYVQIPGLVKEVSLINLPFDDLTEVERSLLIIYKDVMVCSQYPTFYFIIDDDNRLGICDFNGNIVVPPVDGYFAVMLQNFNLGMTEPWGEEYKDKLLKSAMVAGTKSALSFCSCQAVVNSSTLDSVIPYGKYDDIRGFYYFKKKLDVNIWYFVGRMSDDGQVLWGVCDDNGNEVIPVKYKGIVCKKGKLTGTDDMTMSECDALASSNYDVQKAKEEAERELMEIRYELRKVRAERWNKFGKILGHGLLIATDIASQIYGVDADGGSADSRSSGSYQQQYNHWASVAERHYRSLTNLGGSIESSGAAGGIAGGPNKISANSYTQMKRALNTAQNEMAAVRRRASQAGVSISPSKWETASVDY